MKNQISRQSLKILEEEEFKNIYTEENQEPQTLMTNNQTKKEQEKFLEEEIDFLKEENISI